MSLREIGSAGKRTAMAMSGAIAMVTGVGILLGAVPGAAGTCDSGPAQGLESLASLVGEWEVSGTMLDPEGNPVEIRSATTILRTLNDHSIEERSSYYQPPHTVDFVCIRSWDEFRMEYRMACIDSLTGLLDIYEGRFVAGRLVMTNLDTGTYAEANGVRMWGRQTVSEITENSFQLTWEYSLDEGSTWLEFGRLSYRRRGTTSSVQPSSERPARKIEE